MNTERIHEFLDKAFWALLTAVSVYMASELKDISRCLRNISVKIATISTTLEFQEKRLQKIEDKRP